MWRDKTLNDNADRWVIHLLFLPFIILLSYICRSNVEINVAYIKNNVFSNGKRVLYSRYAAHGSFVPKKKSHWMALFYAQILHWKLHFLAQIPIGKVSKVKLFDWNKEPLFWMICMISWCDVSVRLPDGFIIFPSRLIDASLCVMVTPGGWNCTVYLSHPRTWPHSLAFMCFPLEYNKVMSFHRV